VRAPNRVHVRRHEGGRELERLGFRSRNFLAAPPAGAPRPPFVRTTRYSLALTTMELSICSLRTCPAAAAAAEERNPVDVT